MHPAASLRGVKRAVLASKPLQNTGSRAARSAQGSAPSRTLKLSFCCADQGPVRTGIVVLLAVPLLLAVSGRLTLPFGPHRPSALPGYQEDQYEPEQRSRIYRPQGSPATDPRYEARPSRVAHDLRQYLVHQAELGHSVKLPKEVSCRRSHTLDGRNDLSEAFTASYNCTLTWWSGTVRKWCAFSKYPTPFVTSTPQTCEAYARELSALTAPNSHP
jgi:hypothetical protein